MTPPFPLLLNGPNLRGKLSDKRTRNELCRTPFRASSINAVAALLSPGPRLRGRSLYSAWKNERRHPNQMEVGMPSVNEQYPLPRRSDCQFLTFDFRESCTPTTRDGHLFDADLDPQGDTRVTSKSRERNTPPNPPHGISTSQLVSLVPHVPQARYAMFVAKRQLEPTCVSKQLVGNCSCSTGARAVPTMSGNEDRARSLTHRRRCTRHPTTPSRQ